jgi:hypothetical protein
MKLRIIIQVFGLSAPQRIYMTSSAESLSLLRPVPRRNTRGLCSQGIVKHKFQLKYKVLALLLDFTGKIQALKYNYVNIIRTEYQSKLQYM